MNIPAGCLATLFFLLRYLLFSLEANSNETVQFVATGQVSYDLSPVQLSNRGNFLQLLVGRIGMTSKTVRKLCNTKRLIYD